MPAARSSTFRSRANCRSVQRPGRVVSEDSATWVRIPLHAQGVADLSVPALRSTCANPSRSASQWRCRFARACGTRQPHRGAACRKSWLDQRSQRNAYGDTQRRGGGSLRRVISDSVGQVADCGARPLSCRRRNARPDPKNRPGTGRFRGKVGNLAWSDHGWASSTGSWFPFGALTASGVPGTSSHACRRVLRVAPGAVACGRPGHCQSQASARRRNASPRSAGTADAARTRATAFHQGGRSLSSSTSNSRDASRASATA